MTRNYSLDFLHELLVSEVEDGQEISIIDGDGMVVATSAQELGPEDSIDMSGSAVFKKASGGEESGSFIETVKGKKMITSFATEPISGWSIVVSTEYNVIMASANKAMVIMLVIGIVIALVAIVIAVAIGNRSG